MKAEAISGWMPPHELAAIVEIAHRVRPRCMVEIGSWHGRSAIAWAEALPDTMIYCVDPWLPTFNHDLGGASGAGMLEEPYPQFLANTASYPNIRAVRCRSDQALLIKGLPDMLVDLVFIDGDHSEEMVRHDLNFAEYLTRGRGTICGHDYDGAGTPGVRCAVDSWCSNPYRYRLHVHQDTTIFELTPPLEMSTASLRSLNGV